MPQTATVEGDKFQDLVDYFETIGSIGSLRTSKCCSDDRHSSIETSSASLRLEIAIETLEKDQCESV